MTKPSLLLLCSLFCLATTATAADFNVPACTAKPQIDGIIRPDEYRHAATFRGAANYRAAYIAKRPPSIDPRATECAVTWDDDALYIATRSVTASDGTLPGSPKASAFSCECIELWFDPPAAQRQNENARFGQFKLTVAWTGQFEALHHSPGYGYPTARWHIKDLRIRNSIQGNIWDCEIAIPAAAFGAPKLQPGRWGVVLGHNFRTKPAVQCTYAPFNATGGYTDPNGYFGLNLVRQAQPDHYNGTPELLTRALPVPIPGNVTVRVRKTATTPPKEYRRFWNCQDLHGNGYFGLQEVADPDGTPHITLFFHARARKAYLNFTHKSVPALGEECTLSVNILPDRLVYYLDGAFIGELPTDRPIRADEFGSYSVDTRKPGFDILDFRVRDRALSPAEIRQAALGRNEATASLKWYPSKCLMACTLSMPKPSRDADYPRLKILNSTGETVRDLRLPSRPQAAVTTGGKTPLLILHDAVSLLKDGQRLPEGNYKAALYVGASKTPVAEKTFIAKDYEWFQTTVATADVLLPGFTPVTAHGHTIDTVGRSYQFADSGLPVAIRTLGQQILAGPVTLDGVPAPATGAFRLGRSTPTSAAFRGSLAHGRVEQDGLIVLTLDLPPTRGDVALKVPVKAAYAQLYHACGTGIRINPAGFLPTQTGRVFHSRSITQASNSNFISYCWLGTDDRGLCYAADNDHGWLHANDRDAVEIHRQPDGSAVLQLNLLNGPGEHPARRITVALMATPVKPMPTGWRGWIDNYDVPAERNTVNNASNPTWGCYIVGMARYPAFMDWEFVRRMTEAGRTGKVDKAYVENWIQRCLKALDEHPEQVPWLAKQSSRAAAEKTLRAHAFASFYRYAPLHNKKNRVMYYYTCDADPCTGLYELPVMADEWGSSTAVYGSHADYAIYYLKKMCENGMTGVYNDNAFFRPNYDWVTGNAWIDEQGEVHPSYSLWALRTFCRRQIQAMLEAGVKDPWLTIHHTNANILPALSFATNTMGMEWKYGPTEYQDRYTRDYIRTVNQGYQGGFFATSLEGIFDTKSPEQKNTVTRTMLAALLPHEVQPTLSQTGNHQLVRQVLGLKQQFGVGQPDCVYTAYYNPDNPVRQPHPDVMISTYRRGHDLLLIIGSYADGDVDLELKLKHGAIRQARNAENQTDLPITNGISRLPLKRRDFAIIQLTISD